MNLDLAKMCIEEAIINHHRSINFLERALNALETTEHEHKVKELVANALQQRLTPHADPNVLSVAVSDSVAVADIPHG